MITGNFVDQRNECGKCRRILGQVSACRIVDPEEFLSPLEDVARLPVKLRVRTNLKPTRIVKMRAHELQREDPHANRDEQQRKEYRELFSIDPQIAKKVSHAAARRRNEMVLFSLRRGAAA